MALRPSPIGDLIYRPALNHARTLAFVSIRRWRANAKRADLESFKLAKADCKPAPLLCIASEIAETARALLGEHANVWVTSPPPGVSYFNRAGHFATLIAKDVAALLGAPYHQAFQARRPGARKSSSPRTYATRGRLVLFEGLPAGPCLLVDDLATSGSTLEQCHAALSAERLVLPVAWIYGEVVYD